MNTISKNKNMSNKITPQPKIEIAKELKEQMRTQVETESQVIVHIKFFTGHTASLLRVWDNVYLQCKDSEIRSKLLFSENIAIYPEMTKIEAYSSLDFTLVFENLPKECSSFDLIEDIPEKGGFHFKSIQRNDSNVYRLRLR